MRRYFLLAAAAALTAVLPIGAATATAAGGGNSANAKLCQKGGWMNLVRSDQTSFNNQGACVSYGAQGGSLLAAADRAYCAPSGPPTFGQCFYPAELDLDFAASSGPNGQTPSGSFRFERLPSHWAGNVTCLQVNGNVANIGGVITDSNVRPPGSGFSFTAIDNAPDDIRIFQLSASPPAANTPHCGSTTTASFNAFFGEVVTGDIVVKDG
jgi:hypothetical protein